MSVDAFCRILGERIPTAEEFVAFVASMGWKIATREDGSPVLRAKKGDPVAHALARMLSREPYRSQVLVEAKIMAAKPLSRLRQWRWASGMIVDEQTNFASVGDESHHPGLAVWWRYQGDSEWRVIDGRTESLAGECPGPIRASQSEPGQAEHLDGPLPCPRGSEPEPVAVGSGGGEVPERPVQGGLFGSGSADSRGAESL